MANLAIKGHATRGKEVIEILEMLGGMMKGKLLGTETFCAYYIDSDGSIDYKHYSRFDDAIQFALEEFLEKFSYKVGDKAFAFGNKCTIIDAVWDGGIDEVVYTIKLDTSKYTTTKLSNQLQPYKEETMEGQIVTEDITLDKAVMCTFLETVEGKQRLRIAMNEGFELKEENGNFFVYKKNGEYPKTYEECCKILKTPIDNFISKGAGYKAELLSTFQKLLICRDAYWKIAGEQMGLGKLWEPDYIEGVVNTYYTIHLFNNKLFLAGTSHRNAILSFPTGEIRDVFYENFKDLIIECKKLL